MMPEAETKINTTQTLTMIPPIDCKLNTKIMKSRGRPIFICAPAKMGKSYLAMAYARQNYQLDQVLWIDASTKHFYQALETGAFRKSISLQRHRSFSELKLIVVDGIETIGFPSNKEFTSWLEQNQTDELETIVISSDEDSLAKQYSGEYCLINSEQLIDAQVWSDERRLEVLSGFFDTETSEAKLCLAAMMLLMQRGIVDNLRSLGYLVEAGAHVDLKSCCPLIDIDETTGFFDASKLPFLPLSAVLMKHLTAAKTINKNVEKDVSGQEICFERLTQMSTHLFERGEREQSQLLLQLAASLLTHDDAGYPLVDDVAVERLDAHEDGGKRQLVEAITTGIHNNQLEQHACDNALRSFHDKTQSLTVIAMPTATAEEDNDIEPIYIRMFGDFEVIKGGKNLKNKELHRQKVRAILTHLALNLGRGLARDLLLEKIWPQMDYLRAKDNFYTTWSRLTHILDSDGNRNPYLSNNRGICKLENTYVRTDVEEFERLSKIVLLEHGSVSERIDCIHRIEELYRGDLLSGCNIDAYIGSSQRRYRALLVDVMLAASELFCKNGNESSAVWFAQKAYNTDSEREDVYRALMSVQDRAGQRTSALKTYFDCKRFLGEELGILPSQKTIDLYQELILDHR